MKTSIFSTQLVNCYSILRKSPDRPLFYIAVWFIVGICSGYFFGISWTIINILLIIILLTANILLKKINGSNPRHTDSVYQFIGYRLITRITIIFIVILSGAILISWEEYKVENRWSITNYNNKEVLVVAEVIEELSSLEGNKIYLKPYYVGKQKIKYGLIQLDKRYLTEELSNGELVEIELYLKAPSSAQNPGNFSYYNYLKKKGIYSQGYLLGDLIKIGKINSPVRHKLLSFKRRLLFIINKNIVEPYNQVIKALILGERDRLPSDWENSFNKAGVNHLLAISGLHVSFIILVFFTLLTVLKIPISFKNGVLSILMFIYIILTGLRPSVLRAGILAITFLWAPFFNRQRDLFNLLGLSAVINLVLNPYEVMTPGFQLTYLVVVMLITWSKILSRKLPMVVAVSIAAQFGSAPLTAYYFNSIAPVGILTNIWAIPLAGLVVSFTIVILLISLIYPFFIKFTGLSIILLLDILKKGTDLMTVIPGGHLEVSAPPPFIVSLILTFLLVLPFYLKKKIIPINRVVSQQRLRLTIISFLFLILLQMGCSFYLNHSLDVYFLSVGQGDSIYIKSPQRHHILIDGGGYAGLDNSQGEVSIIPFLKYKGIRKLDLILVTHYDADHALGIKVILENRKVSLLALPDYQTNNELAREIIKIAHEKNVPIIILKEGDIFSFGEVTFQVLNPPRKSNFISSNDKSIVLKLGYRNFSLLLTGDLEKDGEYRLIEKGYNLKSSILKLGHHGSKGSTSIPFLKEVSPIETVVSVGSNVYGHPSEALLKRVIGMGINVWRTDEQGAIIINTDGYKYSIKGYQ